MQVSYLEPCLEVSIKLTVKDGVVKESSPLPLPQFTLITGNTDCPVDHEALGICSFFAYEPFWTRIL